MNPWTRRSLVAVLAATACALAGCGSATPSAPPSAAPPSAVPPSVGAPVPAGSAAPVTGTYTPHIDPADFSSTVDNPFFPLRPGLRWEYKSTTKDGVETTVVTVTSNTHTIMGIPCVEVRDTVKLNGEVAEDTLDWYAQHRDGTVWYFGEDTKEYEHGKVTTTKGSWVGGVDGAQPGIVMPAQPLVGDKYRQEYLRGDAEDMAEVLATNDHAQVPAGSYDGTLQTLETTPLEPKALEHKYYARGVGIVLEVDVAGGGVRDELISFSG
jgi:hypothetical protein